MNIQAVAKNVRVSPRKVRLVADAIRNMGVIEAMHLLQVTHKQAAEPLAKTLKSAVANAINNANLEATNLIVGSVMVNEGPAYKRFRPSTRGRIHPYKKRGSNITIVVTEKVVPARNASQSDAGGAKPDVKVEEPKTTKEEKKSEKKEEGKK